MMMLAPSNSGLKCFRPDWMAPCIVAPSARVVEILERGRKFAVGTEEEEAEKLEEEA